MKIAVLMSSYNGEKFIAQQINSVLEQQCEAEVELIVRDDGSTDSTKEILQKYQDEGKLRWYTGENLRPAKSFLHLAANHSSYDYYAFCDQDDYWHCDKLQKGLDLLKNAEGPAMVLANARLVDGKLQDLGRNVYNHAPNRDFCSALCGGGFLGCTIIMNEALAALIRCYPQPEKLIMHDSYVAILCTLYNGQIFFDPVPHMDYRQHGNNVVGTQWTKWAALKNRFARVTKRQQVSIADMAQSILDQNPQNPDPENFRFLQQVAGYRKNFFTALKLACSGKPAYNSLNMAITMRLAILLRNR